MSDCLRTVASVCPCIVRCAKQKTIFAFAIMSLLSCSYLLVVSVYHMSNYPRLKIGFTSKGYRKHPLWTGCSETAFRHSDSGNDHITRNVVAVTGSEWTVSSYCTLDGSQYAPGQNFSSGGTALCVCSNGIIVCSRHEIDGEEMSDAIHVLVGAPYYRLVGLVALVNSIYQNTNATVKFHLITDAEGMSHLSQWLDVPTLWKVRRDIIVFNEQWIKGKLNISRYERGRGKEFMDPMTYSRFYIPRLLPGFSSRLIYMDDDCIVQGDIRELHAAQIKEGHIGAFSNMCQELAIRFKFHHDTFRDLINYNNSHITALGIPPRTCVVNSGLFVVDVGKWKEHNITEQLEYWMELNRKESIFVAAGDQPVFMIVFHGRHSLVDPYWHVRRLGYGEGKAYPPELLANEAQLLHYNGRAKPWIRPSHAYGADIWKKYYVPDPLGRAHVVLSEEPQPRPAVHPKVSSNTRVQTPIADSNRVQTPVADSNRRKRIVRIRRIVVLRKPRNRAD